jgi:hypothetical protein
MQSGFSTDLSLLPNLASARREDICPAMPVTKAAMNKSRPGG